MKIHNYRNARSNGPMYWLIVLFMAASGYFAAGEVRSKAEEEGLTLAAELRARPPVEDFAWIGVLEVRDRNRKTTEIPVRLEVKNETNGWSSTYEASLTEERVRELLVVRHVGLDAPRYYITRTPSGEIPSKLVEVPSEQLFQSFARTDFSLVDLGLDFFHWPQQTVVSNSMRRGQACKVLESVPGKVASTGYSRVLSWVVSESGGIVNAEAWDENKKRLKEFSVRHVGKSKARDRYEVKEMEIRNLQTSSRTRLVFNLEESGPSPATVKPAAIRE